MLKSKIFVIRVLLLMVLLCIALNYGFAAEEGPELAAAQKIQRWYRANKKQFEDAGLERVVSASNKQYEAIKPTEAMAEAFVTENLVNLDSPDPRVYLRSFVLLACFMNEERSSPYLLRIKDKLVSLREQDEFPLKRDAAKLLDIFDLCEMLEKSAGVGQITLREELKRDFDVLSESEFYFIRASLYRNVGEISTETGAMDEAIDYFNRGLQLPKRYHSSFHKAFARMYQKAAECAEGVDKDEFYCKAEKSWLKVIHTARTKAQKTKAEMKLLKFYLNPNLLENKVAVVLRSCEELAARPGIERYIDPNDIKILKLKALVNGSGEIRDYDSVLEGISGLWGRKERLSKTQVWDVWGLFRDLTRSRKNTKPEMANIGEDILKTPDLVDARAIPHVTRELASLYAEGPEDLRDNERAIQLFNKLTKDKNDDQTRALAAEGYVNLILYGNVKTKDWSKALELSKWLYEHASSKERALEFKAEIFGNEDSPYKDRAKQIRVLEDLVRLPGIQEFIKIEAMRKLCDAYVETEGNEERVLELAEQLVIYYPHAHICHYTTSVKLANYLKVPQNEKQREAAIKFNHMVIRSRYADVDHIKTSGGNLLALYYPKPVADGDMDLSEGDPMREYLIKSAGAVFMEMWRAVPQHGRVVIQSEFNAFFVNLTNEEQDLMREIYTRLDPEHPPVDQLMPRGHLQPMVLNYG